MPDHNREAHPLHTLGKSVGEDGVVRCPNCPGLTRVTFQAECMCCGREVAQSQDSGTDDITDSVQALSIGSEVPETPVPLPACRAFVGEFRHLLSLQPVQVHIPEDRRNNVAVPRNLNSIFNRCELTRRQRVETVSKLQLPYRSRNTLRTLFRQLQHERRPPSQRRWARKGICMKSSLLQRSPNLQTRQE